MARMQSIRHQVLAIAGSLRWRSFNKQLLHAAAELAPPALAISLYDDLASVPVFDEDLEAETRGRCASVGRLRAAVNRADGLLIATPEYNQSIPGVLKNAIDWLSRPGSGKGLEGKPVALIGATSGRWGTRLSQSHLRHVLTATESITMPTPNLFVAGAAEIFDAQGRLQDESTAEQLRSVLNAFERWLDRVGGRPT